MLLCPWDSPGKNTGVGCNSLLQGIFLTQETNRGLQHCRQVLYHLSHQGCPQTGIRCHEVGGDALTKGMLSGQRASSILVKGMANLFSFHTTHRRHIPQIKRLRKKPKYKQKLFYYFFLDPSGCKCTPCGGKGWAPLQDHLLSAIFLCLTLTGIYIPSIGWRKTRIQLDECSLKACLILDSLLNAKGLVTLCLGLFQEDLI